MDIFTACNSGNLIRVKELIEQGVDVNQIQDYNKNSPLIEACSFGETLDMGNYLEIIKLLLSRGANINHKNNISWTALMYACDYGHIEIVKLLLDNEADINHTDGNGYNALFIAKHNDSTEIVKLIEEKIKLLEEKIPVTNPKIRTENDMTCKVCLTNEKSVAFDPCGHVCTCERCASKIDKCPICRAPIDKKIKVFVGGAWDQRYRKSEILDYREKYLKYKQKYLELKKLRY